VRLLENGELLTENGFIRTPQAAVTTAESGSNPPAPEETNLLGMNRAGSPSYAAAFVRPLANPEFQHREIPISLDFGVFLERHPARPTADTFAEHPGADPAAAGLHQPSLEESCEWITPGLGVYF
jgi:hypothetical protein